MRIFARTVKLINMHVYTLWYIDMVIGMEITENLERDAEGVPERDPETIGEALKISNETVRVHRRNIYEKLGLSSQGELFRWFLATRG